MYAIRSYYADNSTAVGIPARIVQKGRDKDPLSHNKLPDIDKELFEYLVSTRPWLNCCSPL